MKIDELRDKANRLPLLPGVYIMKDVHGEVIYVGKAKALKNRVTTSTSSSSRPSSRRWCWKIRLSSGTSRTTTSC